jgi:hypothetical protein
VLVPVLNLLLKEDSLDDMIIEPSFKVFHTLIGLFFMKAQCVSRNSYAGDLGERLSFHIVMHQTGVLCIWE